MTKFDELLLDAFTAGFAYASDPEAECFSEWRESLPG